MICSGDSRLSIQGGHDSKITFIVKPLHSKLDSSHLHTLKIGLKIHVCVLGLAMPMHMPTFHQDFQFLAGGPVPPRPPLKLPMMICLY